MGELNELQLKRCIKERKFSPVYLFYGEESYLKKVYCDMVVSAVTDSSLRDFNLHIFQGKDTSLDDIYAANLNMPIMSEYSCVVVYDYPFENMSETDLLKFDELMSDLNESCVLLFVMNETNSKGAAMFKQAVKRISQVGSVVNFEKKTRSDIAKILMSGCKKRGSSMPNFVANYLIMCAGDDLTLLLNEVEKLCAYAGEREITKEDVDLIATKTLESRVFDLSNALMRNDSKRSFEIVENLYNQKEKPENILAVLSSSYIDMYRVKVAVENSAQPSDVANYYEYNKKNIWKLDKSHSLAKKMSLEQLRRCLNVLREADIKIKSTVADKRVVIESTLIKLMIISSGN